MKDAKIISTIHIEALHAKREKQDAEKTNATPAQIAPTKNMN
jgi:hypothetical protein